MTWVYVLHFDRPYKGWMQHYIGYTDRDLNERLAEHRNGYGSRTTRVAYRQGIGFTPVHVERFEDGTAARIRERRLKKSGTGKKLCLVCSPKVEN